MISIIGCTISLIAVLVTIAVSLVFWRAVKSPRAKVLLNLCVAVALSCIFVIVEGSARGNKVCFNIQTVYLLFFTVCGTGGGGGEGGSFLLYFLLDIMNDDSPTQLFSFPDYLGAWNNL